MSSQHDKHMALAATHFKKLAQHHKDLADLHKDLAQHFFQQVASDDMEKGGAETGHLPALYKSFAEHHMSMHKHSLDMVKALAEGTPNVDQETETNTPSFGSNTFTGAASEDFVKQFIAGTPSSAVPSRISATGTLGDPAKISAKLVLRPGQELPDGFDLGKVANPNESSSTLPGFPDFEG
jgi:hypothetical protein